MSDIDAPGNLGYSIGDYGPDLQANKYKLRIACDQAGISWERRILMYAMAMIETNHMTSAERDSSKDQMGLAANTSMFNLSIDLVQYTGYQGDPWYLNKDEGMADAVRVINSGIDQWGVNRLCAFVRGGRQAFNDGYSYGASDYKNTVKSIYYAIQNDQNLLWDSRRVEIYLNHV